MEFLDPELENVNKDCFSLDFSPEAIDSSLRTPLVSQKYGVCKYSTQYLKFTNVPASVSSVDVTKACNQFFDDFSRTLIITITGRAHETAKAIFSVESHITQNLAGLEDQVCTGRSLVFEVAFSESPTKLHQEAIWWLANSQGRLDLVITMRIHEQVARITFETHVLTQPPKGDLFAIVPAFREIFGSK
ncbi:hypothetical protein N7533_009630 [Penicillium manginii]|uniref:uncharacterized protein n=1 Tax=Penicillium manginii TaxID=203109 RepID=UPI0025479791|nr:uncharacterized protein N7533_009630 [Penicillium manginii]KAJ5744760.1 hypothetical protein N7533_009630 [Penicillium manginii]